MFFLFGYFEYSKTTKVSRGAFVTSAAQARDFILRRDYYHALGADAGRLLMVPSYEYIQTYKERVSENNEMQDKLFVIGSQCKDLKDDGELRGILQETSSYISDLNGEDKVIAVEVYNKLGQLRDLVPESCQLFGAAYHKTRRMVEVIACMKEKEGEERYKCGDDWDKLNPEHDSNVSQSYEKSVGVRNLEDEISNLLVQIKSAD